MIPTSFLQVRLHICATLLIVLGVWVFREVPSRATGCVLIALGVLLYIWQRRFRVDVASDAAPPAYPDFRRAYRFNWAIWIVWWSMMIGMGAMAAAYSFWAWPIPALVRPLFAPAFVSLFLVPFWKLSFLRCPRCGKQFYGELKDNAPAPNEYARSCRNCGYRAADGDPAEV